MNADSNAPTWSNNLNGQINLRDAIHRTIKFTAINGKFYKLNDSVAVLLVRPRGWHLPEKHFVVDGQPISGALFDFGVYFFHNAHKAIEIGHGPYFYLPKMESHLEARCLIANCRLWNDVFNFAQDYLGIKRGTIRATCLIETITAAFEMEEIIYELRQHSAGLNCGRWDYIFSCIKKFRSHKSCVLPDRSQVTMTVPFMDAYVKLLIATCHKRGVHAMGGMAAQIPIKSDLTANELAMEKVKKDKTREVTAGHDGTWVAHPDLVRLAKEIFDRHMPQPNQLHMRPQGYEQSADRLIDFSIPGSYISEAGIKENISAALQYIESWLNGNGCVPINHLMEDAATAEIARCQIWQWLHHEAVTKEGRKIDEKLVNSLLESQMAIFQKQLGDKFGKSKFELAKQIFIKVSMKQPLEEFLTTACYDFISGSSTTSSKL